jgi:uncharacterized lipoprotein YddW (UPF0748 family)
VKILCCLFVTDPVKQAEVRALWVVRTSITSPEAIEKLIADAKSANVNTLVVQVRGRGDAFYRSKWEPRSVHLETQPASFDPLRQILDRAHASGIQVHAWLNTHFLANLEELPASPQHVFNAHPEWVAVPRRVATELYSVDPADEKFRRRIVEFSKTDLSQLEGLYTSPSHPAVKEHIYNVFMDVVENYDVDGVHFDYVRFPNVDFDYSRGALDRFRTSLEPSLTQQERQLLSGLAQLRPLVHVELYPEAWDQFRRTQVTELVERVYHGVKARKPDVLVSAAVFANDEDAFEHRFQDWKVWLERGVLDVLCPMAYTPDTEVWKRQIAIARGYAFGRQIWAGIGAYRQPPEGTIEKIRLGRRMGVDGFILFSYSSVVTPNNNAPQGDYLLRLAKEVFP